jgi:hypothetical protein
VHAAVIDAMGHGLDAATMATVAVGAYRHAGIGLGEKYAFDSGEDEMPRGFGLPAMVPTPDFWLGEYLLANCSGGRVEHLGWHRAFDATGRPTDRALFAVTREQP